MLLIIHDDQGEWFTLYDTASIAHEHGGAAFSSQHLTDTMYLMCSIEAVAWCALSPWFCGGLYFVLKTFCSVIKYAKELKMLADGGPVCALCGKNISSDLEEADPLCSLNCPKKCVFHVQCANEWFKRWKCCPICKEEPLPHSHTKSPTP